MHQFYSRPLFVIILLIFTVSCDKPLSFDLANRKEVSPSLRLTEVTNEKGELRQKFVFDEQLRLTETVQRSSDRFFMIYPNELSDYPSSFNGYTCTYADGRIVEVSGTAFRVSVQYISSDRTDFVQIFSPVVPVTGVQTRPDTLSLYRDSLSNLPVRAIFRPFGGEENATVYEFSFDDNSSPYVGLQNSLLPVLLTYPLRESFEDIVTLYADRNILRVYQSSLGVAASMQKPIVIDNSYRFDHIRYDVPTSRASYGSTEDYYNYLYND